MGLADLLQQSESVQDLTVGPISRVALNAALIAYIDGNATANNIDSRFDLTGRGGRAGLDQLLAAIDAFGTTAEKYFFVLKNEAYGMYFEKGQITKSQYRTFMGLSD